MKSVLISGICIVCSMLLLPIISIKGDNTTIKTGKNEEIIIAENIKGAEKFRLLDTAANTITEMETSEYIFGVVAAEMPALYETEALKAQAVAAYTFALYRKGEAEKSGREYDISTDHKTDQSFITRAAAREKWGEKAPEYEQKIEEAVSAVKGLILTYDNKIILSVYHAISSGITEESKNVWGAELPYLVSVDSSADKSHENYLSVVSFPAEELKAKISHLADTSGNENIFSNPKTTEAQTVTEIDINGKTVSGFSVSEALELRSAAFEVSFADGIYTFIVKGYGHGVGMSQNGANLMAKEGKNFKEILAHYYKNSKLTES